MTRRTTFYAFCLMALAVGPPAHAAETVAVRTGNHAGYVRMVFDWAQAVPYSLRETGQGGLSIVFGRAARLDTSGADVGTGKTVTRLAALPASGDALQVDVTLAPGTTVRHFAMGSRVIVDLMASAAQGGSLVRPAPSSASPSPSPSPAPSPSASVPPPSAAPSAPAVVPPKPARIPADRAGAGSAASPGTAKAPAPEKPAAPSPAASSAGPAAAPAPTAAAPTTAAATVPPADAAPAIAPHTVNVATTAATGLAVFVRHNDLWVVMDRPDVVLAPEITGPTPELFPGFTRQEIQGGSAFRMALPRPASLRVYGGGGGLIWRILLTPEEQADRPVPLERTFLADQSVRGGTALWPLRNVTKIIEMTDPDAGDKLMVGTVDAATQFAGPGQEFVEFSLLDSPIGIAVAPKVDDILVESSAKGFSVTRPGGLALSRPKDVNRRLIREAISAESADAPESGGKPESSMRRLYDLDRKSVV